MAAFAQVPHEESFGYSEYSAHRPVYPLTLYTTHLLPYHHGPRSLLLDLGCGPGTVTRPLSHYFTSALGTDPSAGMLAAAAAATPSSEYPNITYRAGSAESLPFLAAGSVDMAVGAQCAHWFSYPEFWAEMARVVRPRGTLACWGYKDPVFVRSRKASAVLARYTYGGGKLGPYWAQPGRGRVQGRYRCLVPPDEQWGEVQRWEYEPTFVDVDVDGDRELEELGYVKKVVAEEGMGGRLVREGERLLGMSMALGRVEAYVRTWSATHLWKEANRGHVSRAEGGGGDVVDELMDEVRGAVPEWDIEGWRDVVVEVELGHAVVCARRRE